jgi:hypothetical protein
MEQEGPAMPASRESRPFDSAKAEAFAGSFLAALNHGALCLMASVGHRTGLFDAMREMPPSTPAEIATRTGLSERYVREWLGAMTTGGVVDVDPDTDRFSLPAEHAAFLTRAAAAVSIPRIRAWACGLRTKATWCRPGRTMSPT